MRAAYEVVMNGASPNLDISLDAGADSDDKSKVRASEAKPLIRKLHMSRDTYLQEMFEFCRCS